MAFIFGQDRGHIRTAADDLHRRTIHEMQGSAAFWTYEIIGAILLQLKYSQVITNLFHKLPTLVKPARILFPIHLSKTCRLQNYFHDFLAGQWFGTD